MSPQHILYIYKDYFPVLGGIENHVRVLAEAAAARGHEVTVLVTSLDRHSHIETLNGVRVIFAARLATAASTPISPALFAWAARLRADIAHLHFPYPPGEIANLIFRPARRTVISYHSDVVRQARILRFYKPILMRVLRRADALVIGSPPMRHSAYLSEHQTKVRLVPYGIPTARFAARPSDAELARAQAQYIDAARAGRAEVATPLLLFVGRLRYYKGLDTLIHALPRIDARLLAVGTGPMEGAWRALAQATGVSDRIAWLGEVPDADLPALYHLADLFVLPASHASEAFGLVQVEAMSAGLPCVTTELGTGTSWVVQDGVTGRIVPPGDPEALAQAIRSLLADPDLRRRMGHAGADRARAEFDERVMVDRVLGVYTSLLDGK
jgi:rhamnosyl/mannosyltransferase